MIKSISKADLDRIYKRLKFLYGERADWLLDRFYHLHGRYGVGLEPPLPTTRRWDQKDVVLITYADMVQAEGKTPLMGLRDFCFEQLKGAVNTVHILPFYPW
ncbi:MAG: sugar phosphorylase, partial [Verrucomicrobiota bacterium]